MDIDASFCYYVRRKEKESQIFTLTTVAIFQKYLGWSLHLKI